MRPVSGTSSTTCSTLTRCSGHRCSVSAERIRREVARNTQQKSHHTDPVNTSGGQCSYPRAQWSLQGPHEIRRDARSTSPTRASRVRRSEEHTSELQSLAYLVCRLLLEKKKKNARVI